jgi:hypothetical protein
VLRRGAEGAWFIFQGLYGFFAPFAGSNPHDFFHRQDKYFPITDFA